RVPETRERWRAMGRKVTVLPNSPKHGLAGCQWNGTEASIWNGGRRTLSLVMARARYACVRECKGHGRARHADDEGTDPRRDPRGARTIRAAEALAVGGGRRPTGGPAGPVPGGPAREGVGPPPPGLPA